LAWIGLVGVVVVVVAALVDLIEELLEPGEEQLVRDVPVLD